MNLGNILKGIAILQQYYDEPEEGSHVGCEHDELILYKTDNPVTEEHFNELAELGWHQFDVNNEENDFDLYDPEESWAAYV